MASRSYTDLTDALFFAGRLQETADVARRGLAYLQEEVSSDRVRLLATLGLVNGAAGAYGPANTAFQDGLNVASQLSDPKLEAGVLGARSTVSSLFLRLKEAAADGFRSQQLGGRETPLWQRSLQLRILHQTLLYLGRRQDALRIVDELEPLARRIGDTFTLTRSLSTRAWAEFGEAPNLAKLETDLGQLLRRPSEYAGFWEAVFRAQESMLHFFRGDSRRALLIAQAACAPEAGSVVEGVGVGTLFRHLAYAADRDRALAILNGKRKWLPVSGQPNPVGSWSMLALVIEGLVMLGERSQAGQLYPLARELVGTDAISLWTICRFSQTVAGIAASGASEWEAAEEHFQIALQQAESFPHRLEQADIRRFQAMMLLDRSARGDREKARTLLNKALGTYAEIGMPRHIEITRTLLDHTAHR